MGCQHKNLRNLHMLRCIGGVKGNAGNVVASQRLYALIHIVGPLAVSVETNDAEIRLHKPRLDIRYTHGGVRNVNAQAVGDGLYRRLCGAVNISSGHKPRRRPPTRY